MTGIVHFSLPHYEHMVAVGAFSGKFEKHVELLRGEIVTMSPIGAPHCLVVTRLARWSYAIAPEDKFEVFTQGSIRIPISDSEPEPDLTWVIQSDYSRRHPEPHEVALLVEVAESSLETDRGTKLSIYAEAGITDYWIVNVIDQQIEVHRNPVGREYQDRIVCRGDTAISPLALPAATLRPSQLFS